MNMRLGRALPLCLEALTGQQSNGKGKKGKVEWKRRRGSIPESCGRILKFLTERLQGAAVYGI
jgi:hypothetical protein